VEGEVFDVAVDIRRSSPTFGKWVGAVLSAENKRQLWIPEGFAHGFMALSDTVQFVYKATNYYAPQSERSIIWNDPEIGIDCAARCRCRRKICRHILWPPQKYINN
jgi:dTDP-4-dehydrorhamnose 3,5-epimerase